MVKQAVKAKIELIIIFFMVYSRLTSNYLWMMINSVLLGIKQNSYQDEGIFIKLPAIDNENDNGL